MILTQQNVNDRTRIRRQKLQRVKIKKKQIRKKRKQNASRKKIQAKRKRNILKTQSQAKRKRISSKTKNNSKQRKLVSKTQSRKTNSKRKCHSQKRIRRVRSEYYKETERQTRRVIKKVTHLHFKQLIRERKRLKRIERRKKTREHFEAKKKKKLESYRIAQLKKHFDETCDTDLPEGFSIGLMNNKCPDGKAVFFESELLKDGNIPALCCNHGKIKIPSIPRPPQMICDLLSMQHPKSKFFLTHIRKFNSMLSMVSTVANKMTFKTNGPPIYKIQGSIYHKIGPLLPDDDEAPVYAQLYFYEPDQHFFSSQTSKQHESSFN